MGKKYRHKNNLLLCLIWSLLTSMLQAQSQAPYGLKYQGVARTKTGKPINDQQINVKAGIYSGSANGTLVWEETHSILTDPEGLFVCIIGNGSSTGNGSVASFSDIAWQTSNYYLKIAIDYTGGNTFVVMGTAQLRAVPYAFYSTGSGYTKLSLDELTDVDTGGIQPKSVLKFNGSVWKPLTFPLTDSTSYATKSGRSIHSGSSGYAGNSVKSEQSDTAVYASQFAPYNWSVTGNKGYIGKFLGTTVSEDLVFKSNGTERMRLQTSGKLGAGTASPAAQLHVKGNDGFILMGTFGSGILPDSSYNTRFMWYPKKASCRIGQINSANWNSNNIGNYSFAAGYNTKASGLYSHAFGYNCSAQNENCISMGKDCSTDILSGAISNGGSLALGDSCSVTITRSVAMGYKVINNGGIGLGYKVKVSGGGSSAAFGAYTNSAGINSIALGYYASDNGKVTSFIFADKSAATVTSNTANNQFMARASGGVIFYSASAMDNGVQLYPGGGAWASACDVNKKENFKNEDPEQVLQRLMRMEIKSWNYKSQPDLIRHIGPMAQDFYKAFLLGENKRAINTIDIDGVNLSAIKALEKRTRTLKDRLENTNTAELNSELKSIDHFDSIEKRVEKLEQALGIH